VFLEMGLYRSRIEFLVMFEVVQHMKMSHKSDELKKKGGSTNQIPMTKTWGEQKLILMIMFPF
jgi:hypothetical protein